MPVVNVMELAAVVDVKVVSAPPVMLKFVVAVNAMLLAAYEAAWKLTFAELLTVTFVGGVVAPNVEVKVTSAAPLDNVNA